MIMKRELLEPYRFILKSGILFMKEGSVEWVYSSEPQLLKF